MTAAEFTVVFALSRKELQALDPPVASRILKSIEARVSSPRLAEACQEFYVFPAF